MANSEEEFHSLHLKIYDENDKELDITKIVSSTPFNKKINVKLTRPIFPGDKGRSIKLMYDSPLTKNTFENFFLNDTGNFELNFSHYSNLDYTPSLFYFDNRQGAKNLIEPSSKITKGVFTNHKWEKTEEIHIGDSLRLNW